MDPILLAIAAAAAGKTTEALAEGVKRAARLVRERFAGESEHTAVLLAAQDDEARLEDLSRTLERVCAERPDFHARLSELTGRRIEITGVRTETRGNITFQNNFNDGAPDKVIQAERIENLHLD